MEDMVMEDMVMVDTAMVVGVWGKPGAKQQVNEH